MNVAMDLSMKKKSNGVPYDYVDLTYDDAKDSDDDDQECIIVPNQNEAHVNYDQQAFIDVSNEPEVQANYDQQAFINLPNEPEVQASYDQQAFIDLPNAPEVQASYDQQAFIDLPNENAAHANYNAQWDSNNINGENPLEDEYYPGQVNPNGSYNIPNDGSESSYETENEHQVDDDPSDQQYRQEPDPFQYYYGPRGPPQDYTNEGHPPHGYQYQGHAPQCNRGFNPNAFYRPGRNPYPPYPNYDYCMTVSYCKINRRPNEFPFAPPWGHGPFFFGNNYAQNPHSE